jgi:WD40 repeat protein
LIAPRPGRFLPQNPPRPLSDEAAGVVAAAAGRDLFVRRGGKKVRVPLRAPIVGVAVSRDGSRAAAASDSQVVVVSPSGRRTVLASPNGRVTSVAFSPDGRRVVSGTRGGAVVVWRTDRGREQTFRPHSDVVADAQFSPDGRWIVTAGPRTASLIDTSRDRVVFLLRGHRGSLTGAAFGPSGRRIYTAGDDGTVRVYGCQICGGLPALETLARRRLRALG